MKVQRTYYRRNIGSLNKGAEIELLRVLVSYVLNTVIPVFALPKSNRLTFHLVNRQEFSVPSDYQVKRNLPLSSSNESGFFRRHKKAAGLSAYPFKLRMILLMSPQNCGQIPENIAKTCSVNAKGSFRIQPQLDITGCDFKIAHSEAHLSHPILKL